MIQPLPKPNGRRSSGFTVIELLVVFSIIAVLAGLLVYLLPSITEKKVRGRVRAELTVLELAINAYKAKYGFYPQDNPSDPAQSPLFYELTGTERKDASGLITFRDRDNVVLDTNTIGTYFKTSGFINTTDTDAKERRNYGESFKTNTSYRAIDGSPGVQLLMVPYKGPNGDFNPWNYNSSTPQHHPEGFDLWATVVVGGKTITIGNWRD
jgi:type II secretory pathway pseudopilin PulG